MTHKKKWLLFAPAGLVLVGAGASMVHWAGGLKDRGRPAPEWIGAGTLALSVLNAGLSVFGRGVVENVLYQQREKPQAQLAAGADATSSHTEGPGTRNIGLG